MKGEEEEEEEEDQEIALIDHLDLKDRNRVKEMSQKSVDNGSS